MLSVDTVMSLLPQSDPGTWVPVCPGCEPVSGHGCLGRHYAEHSIQVWGEPICEPTGHVVPTGGSGVGAFCTGAVMVMGGKLDGKGG